MIDLVVTVYNKSEFIESTLASIDDMVEINPYPINVIIVDDGSTDNSLNLIKEFRYKSFEPQIITGKNKGVSSARNKGILKASGKFIVFLDGDDKLHPESFRESCIYSIVNNLAYPLITTNIYENKEAIIDSSYSIEEPLKLLRKGWWRSSVCGVLFPLELIKSNGICFPLGLQNGEDTIFTSLVLAACKKVYLTRGSWYIVRRSSDSLSRDWSLSKSQNMLAFVRNWQCINSNSSDLLNRALRFRSTYSLISNALYNLCVEDRNRGDIKRLVRDSIRGLPFIKFYWLKWLALRNDALFLRIFR